CCVSGSTLVRGNGDPDSRPGPVSSRSRSILLTRGRPALRSQIDPIGQLHVLLRKDGRAAQGRTDDPDRKHRALRLQTPAATGFVEQRTRRYPEHIDVLRQTDGSRNGFVLPGPGVLYDRGVGELPEELGVVGESFLVERAGHPRDREQTFPLHQIVGDRGGPCRLQHPWYLREG